MRHLHWFAAIERHGPNIPNSAVAASIRNAAAIGRPNRYGVDEGQGLQQLEIRRRTNLNHKVVCLKVEVGKRDAAPVRRKRKHLVWSWAKDFRRSASDGHPAEKWLSAGERAVIDPLAIARDLRKKIQVARR